MIPLSRSIRIWLRSTSLPTMQAAVNDSGPTSPKRWGFGQYLNCPLLFYRIEGGGHSWPGSPVADLQPASLGHTTTDIDATAVSWELFKSVSLP